MFFLGLVNYNQIETPTLQHNNHCSISWEIFLRRSKQQPLELFRVTFGILLRSLPKLYLPPRPASAAAATSFSLLLKFIAFTILMKFWNCSPQVELLAQPCLAYCLFYKLVMVAGLSWSLWGLICVLNFLPVYRWVK